MSEFIPDMPPPYIEHSKEDLEMFEIMDGMNEVNCKMADKIEEAMKEEQPTCHFTKMNYDDGLWVCEHCSHEVESEVAPYDDTNYDY